MFVCLSLCLSVSLSDWLSVCLSVCFRSYLVNNSMYTSWWMTQRETVICRWDGISELTKKLRGAIFNWNINSLGWWQEFQLMISFILQWDNQITAVILCSLSYPYPSESQTCQTSSKQEVELAIQHRFWVIVNSCKKMTTWSQQS